MRYEGGDVGAEGAPGTGSYSQAAKAPAATTPAPTATAIATVLPAELVVVTVVADVTGVSSPLILIDVGVKTSVNPLVTDHDSKKWKPYQ